MGMMAILIKGLWPFVQIYNPCLTGSIWNLKKTGLRISEEVIQRCGQKDDEQQMITIAHPEPLAQVS